MTAIAATRRQCSELVDGTLVVKMHVAPYDKAAFLALMPDVDTPCFIARDVRHEQLAPDWHKDFADAPKGGPHSQDAARICKDAEFQEFVRQKFGWGKVDEDLTAVYVRQYCQIESRAELDHSNAALDKFHQLMREFSEWKEVRRTAPKRAVAERGEES